VAGAHAEAAGAAIDALRAEVADVRMRHAAALYLDAPHKALQQARAGEVGRLQAHVQTLLAKAARLQLDASWLEGQHGAAADAAALAKCAEVACDEPVQQLKLVRVRG